ncbi:MAG: NAD-dependent epimerase/dehydratase family protein [Phycisphaera sp.]|nr:MAG: NAD-dependent epimerase/dehydratase family protein [Phycisphaera sp.]
MTTGSQTYIVTGGCGFIGSNLVAELQTRVPGAHVIVIDSMRTGSFESLVSACERHGDTFQGEVLGQSIRDVFWPELLDRYEPDAVFHLGAITDTTVEDEAEMIEENAGETWPEMIEACVERDVPLVYASSAATYGTPPETNAKTPFPETSAGKPNNVYGFSKWLMEQAHARVTRECESAGLKKPWIVGLRYFNVFGPGEAHKGKMASMALQLTNQILDGERPRLFEHGEQARDQVSVHDIVGITLAGAGLGERKDPAPGVYNAGFGRSTSFEEIACAVRRGLGIADAERPTEFIPMPANIRRFYQDFTCADMSKAETGLGFKPSHDPAEAVSTYARWAADQRD